MAGVVDKQDLVDDIPRQFSDCALERSFGVVGWQYDEKSLTVDHTLDDLDSPRDGARSMEAPKPDVKRAAAAELRRFHCADRMSGEQSNLGGAREYHLDPVSESFSP
jgi:hypothetical protein